MNLLIFSLILIPTMFSFIFLLSENKMLYKLLSYLLFIFGASASIALAIHGPFSFQLSGVSFSLLETIINITEALIIIFLFWISKRHNRKSIFLLTFLQAILFIYSTFFMEKHKEVLINVDSFSIIMLLLVNIIGTLILIFSNSYITEYEHHRHMKSKQRLFYFVISIFLAAMNGLVISDALGLVYFFWEITTLASFILISYNGDEEAYNSGFRALFINMIGALCFSIGIILFQNLLEITSLTAINAHGKLSGIYIIPIFLLCIAGFTKSAQMPFNSWLLGAMVAPTPVSALLHSSTMVKAGVYLIVKLAPAYAGTKLGTAIALYGGITFLLCSAIAVTQRNAKRILAYSTIANLGLIICSAGMGSSLSIAAAIILIVFHAVSKALLFLCTGQIEHTIGSRDVEAMSGLITKAPVLTLITAFGLISMILPPFGVLITKLISIEATAQNPFLVILIILGSALTTLYYIKWMGTLLAYPASELKLNKGYDLNIYTPLWILSALVLITSIFVAPLYNNLVSPELKAILPKAPEALTINNANIITQTGSFNNNIVFIVIAFIILIALLVHGTLISKTRKTTIYMCGENNKEDQDLFRAHDGTYEKAVFGNYYLTKLFDENLLTKLGTVLSVALILIVILGGLS